MAIGIHYIPDIEHEGDIEYYRSLIIDNGGDIENVVWNGTEDDDAYIVFSAPTRQQITNIKLILENE